MAKESKFKFKLGQAVFHKSSSALMLVVSRGIFEHSNTDATEAIYVCSWVHKGVMGRAYFSEFELSEESLKPAKVSNL